MADAALEIVVSIFPGEFAGISCGVRMRRPVGITFQRNGWYADRWRRGKLLFQLRILWLAGGCTYAPAIIMDDNGYMIRVVKCCSGTVKRAVGKVPLR